MGWTSVFLPEGAKCGRCGADISRRHYHTKYCGQCVVKHANARGAKKAHAAVTRAVARGDLPPANTQACIDCGKPARDYDHRDYGKPLEVQPVCRSCNKLRGPALPATEAA